MYNTNFYLLYYKLYGDINKRTRHNVKNLFASIINMKKWCENYGNKIQISQN